MNREDADDAFDCLSRHARAIPQPSGPVEALKLIDAAALAQLQRDAIIHYISVGPAVVNLAYRVLKAGTATFVAARFAAERSAGRPAGPPVERELFAERMIVLAGALTVADPAGRAAGLIDALSARLDGGRELLGRIASPEPETASDGVGDLFEAAGIAYVLAQLLENPPAPVVVLNNGR